jgi:tetratricopeptide (TPR) repeat protein
MARLAMSRRSRLWLLATAGLLLVGGAASLSAVHGSSVWIAGAVATVGALGSVLAGSVQAAVGAGGRKADTSSDRVPLRQLPPVVPDFTGRGDELDQLKALLQGGRRPASGDAGVTVVITGQGGVGKTALAIQVANELSKRFPIGQLYVSLRGHDAAGCSDPALVLADLARDLAVDPAAIPEGLEERARLVRDRLAGQRALLLLDDARDEAQVRPLLPGGGSCAVIITSRSRLAGLAVTARVGLDVLTTDQAVDLLRKLAGPRRISAEPEQAICIVEACGHLPLAVRVAGARLSARPAWPLQQMADRLTAARRPLDELSVGDLDVRASLQLSYRDQPREIQRAFRLLGLVQAQEFAAWMLAAAVDEPLHEAVSTMEQLVEAQLVQPLGPDPVGQLRYQFHDLVREFAQEKLGLGNDTDQGAALERILGACLWFTDHAEPLIEPGGFSHIPASAPRWPGRPDTQLLAPLRKDPFAWYKAERAVLVAAVGQAHDSQHWDATWELADNLCSYLDPNSLWDDWADAHQLALPAARNAGNRYGEAVVRRNLGVLYRMRGLPQDARAHFASALETFDDLDDDAQQADTLGNLADLLNDLGDHHAAADLLQRSLGHFRRAHIERGEAWAYQLLADTRLFLDQPDKAHMMLDSAEPLFRKIGDIRGLAWALRSRGDAHRRQASTDLAAASYEQAVTLLTQSNDRRGTALVMASRAALYQNHDARRAITEYQQALFLSREIGDMRQQARVLLAIGDVYSHGKRKGMARGHYQQSKSIFTSINDHRGIAQTEQRIRHLDGTHG